MLYGYARTGYIEHSICKQEEILLQNKVTEKNIYIDENINMMKNCIALQKLLNTVKEGDTILVTDLTRISCSTKDLISILHKLDEIKVNLKSINDRWFNKITIAGLLEYEKNIITERTKIGLNGTRARGKKGGRKSVNKDTIEKALKLYDSEKVNINDICKECKICRQTLYKYIRKRSKQ